MTGPLVGEHACVRARQHNAAIHTKADAGVLSLIILVPILAEPRNLLIIMAEIYYRAWLARKRTVSNLSLSVLGVIELKKLYV